MAGKTSRTAKVREQDYVRWGEHPNAIPHLPWPSVLSTSGLAPAICNHGLATLPPDHRPVGRTPSINGVTHGERPILGGKSWVRVKYIGTDFRCIICHGAERPTDFTEYREARGD